MESLYAEFLLWKHKFRSSNYYEELLDKYFLLTPENEFLLEIEEYSNDISKTSECFLYYWTYKHPAINSSDFGKSLFYSLRRIYESNELTIEDFGKHCYLLWKDLPPLIYQTEPFWTLSYADDSLSWGDEAQT
ncbi:MAG: hypothetical protein RR336_11020, partial [Oscillospiraceae bacterium]